MGAFRQRALADTWRLVGEPAGLLNAAIIAVIASLFYIAFKIMTAGAVDVVDVGLSLLSGGLAFVLCGVVAFFYNLVCAPYRIERDRANAAEIAVKALQNRTHAEVPAAHLLAMQRYDETLAGLGEKSGTIAKLVDQYSQLTKASRYHSQGVGIPQDNDQLVEIAELIFSQLSRFVAPLPHAPKQGLRVSLGWNHELFIFDVPMRRPPDIKIDGLPPGSHAEVTKITRLSFEVRFWPDNLQISSYGVEASAEI